MRYMRCKCGKSEAWTTMGHPECSGCSECNTTLAESADGHTTPIEHEWKEEFTIDKVSGARGKQRICMRCMKREVLPFTDGSADAEASTQ